MPAYRAMTDLNAPPPGHPGMSIPHGMDLSGLSGRVSSGLARARGRERGHDVSVGKRGGWRR